MAARSLPPLGGGEAGSLSAGSGGTVQFDVIAGSPRAGEFYFLLGSASGTSPGFTWNGINVPLNLDGYSLNVAGSIGTGLFANWVGALDSRGRASASLTLPRLPRLIQSTEYILTKALMLRLVKRWPKR